MHIYYFYLWVLGAQVGSWKLWARKPNWKLNFQKEFLPNVSTTLLLTTDEAAFDARMQEEELLDVIPIYSNVHVCNTSSKTPKWMQTNDDGAGEADQNLIVSTQKEKFLTNQEFGQNLIWNSVYKGQVSRFSFCFSKKSGQCCLSIYL